MMAQSTGCSGHRKYRLRRLVLSLIAGFVVINTVVVVLARARPTAPTMQGFAADCAGKPSPCWFGIVPGTTTLAEARQRLQQAGYRAGLINDPLNQQYFYSNELVPGCVRVSFARGSNVLTYLRLYCLKKSSVGEITASLGLPDSIVYSFSLYGDVEYMTYDHAESAGGMTIISGSGWGSLTTPITTIEMFHRSVFSQVSTVVSSWHGFVSMRRYCQFEPNYPRCR
jgi:hypothetical protein